MPYLDTAQSWLTQSTLLLQARPTTTRITTKYTIRKPSTSSTTKPETTTQTTSTPKPDPPRAQLTLKTYCPTSGTTLKYRTTKAAEVSRLIQILGRLARPMAGLSVLPLDLDTPIPDAVAAKEDSGTATPAVVTPAPVAASGQQGVGGKNKKKKGGKK